MYDYCHIGNLRAILNYDLLKRWLRYIGYDVEHICNLTDVDDKIIERLRLSSQTLREYTQTFVDAFLEDLQVRRRDCCVLWGRHDVMRCCMERTQVSSRMIRGVR